jgi:hypothetical protein
VGAAAAEVNEAHMREKLAQFKSSLEAFALKYRRVRRLPRARAAAVAALSHALCGPLLDA